MWIFKQASAAYSSTLIFCIPMYCSTCTLEADTLVTVEFAPF